MTSERTMRTSSTLSGVASVAFLLTVSACSSADPPAGGSEKATTAEQHAEEGAPHGAKESEAEPIRFDAAAMQAAGIRLAQLEASAMHEQVRAPGEVLDSAYGTTLITPRVVGIAVRRHAKLGDEVPAGARLVTLTSVEVSEAQGQLAIAEQEWRRMQSLGPDAVSGRRYAEARVAYEQARARARAYGLPGTAPGDASGEFTLVAPHAGRITEDDFVVGERIEPGRTLFRLVDERIVWIDAKMPSEAAQRVAVGDKATVVAGAVRLDGKVLRQAHRTSEATRTAVVRIEVMNDQDRLHGGDYVDVYLDVHGQAVPQLAVPTAALVQLEGETVVFRQDTAGALAPVEVRTGAVMGDYTVIVEGLAAGDTVVIEGAYALKARLLKAQLGAGHVH